MDRETMKHFGWIVIVTLILAVMLAFATPFGKFVGQATGNILKGYTSVNNSALEEENIKNLENEWNEFLNSDMDGGTSDNSGEGNNNNNNGNDDDESGGDVVECKHVNTKIINAKEATCTQSGYTGDTYCNDCGKTIASGKTVAATGHKDNNNDGKCDSCGTTTATTPLHHNGTIYKGAVYTTQAGSQLQEDLPFPKITHGDSYRYGEYSYTYSQYLDGWTAYHRYRDYETVSGDILWSINGKNVVSMDGCYSSHSLVTTENIVIPETVTNINDLFWLCEELVDASSLIIPDSVTTMEQAFNGCKSLVSAPTIPQNVTNMDYAFRGCVSLEGRIVVNANPSNYNKCFELHSAGKTIIITGKASAATKKSLALTSSVSYRSVIVE